MDNLKITNIEDIRKLKDGDVIELPSFDGSVDKPFVARVRRPSLLTLCANETIPNTLLSKAQAIYEGDKKGSIKEFAEVLHTIAKVALVEPAYDDVKDFLTDEQLTAIFNYTQVGVKALEPFRKLAKEFADFLKARGGGKKQ